MKFLYTVVPLSLVVAGCMQAPPPATDPSVITSRSDAWEAALNAGDVDAVVGIYTPDARVLAPNRKMASGSAAVRAEFGAMIDAGLGGELTSVETTVSGDVGYNVGTFTLRAGGETVDTGKFIETWRRGSDGVWRISNDIYNSDMPLPDPESGTHVMISHEVDDAERWMAAWRGEDSRHMLFKANGADHVHTFVNPANPHSTGLVVKVNDLSALVAMLESEDGLATAAEDGVRLDTIKMLKQSR